MTLEQRKISLINWIAKLDEEAIINQLETFRKSLNDLPNEIQVLLKKSDSTDLADCKVHSSSKEILKSR